MEHSGPKTGLAQGQIPFSQLLAFWFRLGWTSFGGPVGQIALIHAELVERRRWVSEAEFLNALNFCMLLPGPEAQQLATYLGWLLSGTPGGIAAGVLFVLPAALLLWMLSWVYVTLGALSWMAGMFDGIKPAVLAVVAASIWRMGQRILTSRLHWGVAGAAFALLFLWKVPVAGIFAGAGVAGYVGWQFRQVGKGCETQGPSFFSRGAEVTDQGGQVRAPLNAGIGMSLRTGLVWGAVWWVPLLGVGMQLGWQHSVSSMGVFFSKAALLTLGGAYAILPLVAEQAVAKFHWLTHAQMLDGIGLAEITPGPLLIVLQYVGFLGAWKQHGDLPPLVSATLGALVASWATFAPSFFWVFVGAPYLERLQRRDSLRYILNVIGAAVLGLIVNLALWLGQHVLLSDTGRPEWFACLLCTISFWGIFVRRWPFPGVALASALAAIVRTFFLAV